MVLMFAIPNAILKMKTGGRFSRALRARRKTQVSCIIIRDIYPTGVI
jgi:hypothetical protein